MVDVAPAPEVTEAPPAEATAAPPTAWVTSLDHRRLGLAYLAAAFALLGVTPPAAFSRTRASISADRVGFSRR